MLGTPPLRSARVPLSVALLLGVLMVRASLLFARLGLIVIEVLHSLRVLTRLNVVLLLSSVPKLREIRYLCVSATPYSLDAPYGACWETFLRVYVT